MATFKWLSDYDELIASYTIHDLRESGDMHYINIEVHLKDSSQLFIKEFNEPGRRKYSFHWQSRSGELILRWDNAPHFQNLPNFPHHKHLPDQSVESSYDIPLEDVLQYIANRIY
ncbi:hypothetical protein SAMN04487996_103300 [Dyadobacter soli]|uniref:Uncharacterized protein n=1 Tax=Dyadobacter soli TaxID=659014 RepID=A0A1G7A0T3_9BACT|nr:DUF6516 family protein [Dyadobacter soli]SDE08432.1 hypothetical protein SAMN04487996_103300 [Dyadobacter soli]